MDREPFLYTGQSKVDIPWGVKHIKVDPSVKTIDENSFVGGWQLRNIELNEGLEEIGDRAFSCCTSLTSIIIPSTVKSIGESAFDYCNQLRNVELREGLERINNKAFRKCYSIRHIRIPSTVDFIAEDAFDGCDDLETIEFCEEIEQFVEEASLSWWNRGVLEESLKTYSFMAQHNIPSRLDTIKCQTWKDNIHDIFQRIPEEFQAEFWELYLMDQNHRYDNDVRFVFVTILRRLHQYEYLQGVVAPMLELVLWKEKITEQSNGDLINERMKLQCRYDSLSMVSIIIPNALSFL